MVLAADLELHCSLCKTSGVHSHVSLSTLFPSQGSSSDEETVGWEGREEPEGTCEEDLPNGLQRGPAEATHAPVVAAGPLPRCGVAEQQQHSFSSPLPSDSSAADAAAVGVPALDLGQLRAPPPCWFAQLLEQPTFALDGAVSKTVAVLSQVMSHILPLGGVSAAPRRRRAAAGPGSQACGLDCKGEDGGPLRRVRRCHDLPSLAATGGEKVTSCIFLQVMSRIFRQVMSRIFLRFALVRRLLPAVRFSPFLPVVSHILPLGSAPATPRRLSAAVGLDRADEDAGLLRRVTRCQDLPGLRAFVRQGGGGGGGLRRAASN